MPKPYSICILSLKNPNSLDESRSSVHMMAWALWNEFSKLPHVTLEFQSIYEPISNTHPDFVLFHACFGDHAFNQLAEMRKRAKYKTISFMELGLAKAYVDYCFVYLPQTAHQHCEEISLPCLSSTLDEHNTSKKCNTILLDHIWPSYYGTMKEWSPYLYEWLAGHPEYDISQLRRNGCALIENFPEWVTPIVEKPYTEYLDTTAHFETFILTHQGSYEHSVIDMAYRGTRVLVPMLDGRTFIPRSTIDRLNLQTFSNQHELLSLLKTPVTKTDKRQSFTDISKIVSRIDAYCQENI